MVPALGLVFNLWALNSNHLALLLGKLTFSNFLQFRFPGEPSWLSASIAERAFGRAKKLEEVEETDQGDVASWEWVGQGTLCWVKDLLLDAKSSATVSQSWIQGKKPLLSIQQMIVSPYPILIQGKMPRRKIFRQEILPVTKR